MKRVLGGAELSFETLTKALAVLATEPSTRAAVHAALSTRPVFQKDVVPDGAEDSEEEGDKYAFDAMEDEIQRTEVWFASCEGVEVRDLQDALATGEKQVKTVSKMLMARVRETIAAEAKRRDVEEVTEGFVEQVFLAVARANFVDYEGFEVPVPAAVPVPVPVPPRGRLASAAGGMGSARPTKKQRKAQKGWGL